MRGLLSHAFVYAQQHVLAAADAAAASTPTASSSSSIDSTSLIQSTFSYHALLGGDQCTPENWERSWGLCISILLAAYLCIVLTRLCDQYLIPSLEVTSKKWGLSEDVAGVTLLAFGGSFPELAIHMIATIEGSEIGVGTVIGSAVFNVTIGLAVAALLTSVPVLLLAGPLIRDSLMYIFCLSLILILFNWNAQVLWWQALIMVILYVVYVVTLILKYQQETNTGIFSPRSPNPESPDHVVDVAPPNSSPDSARAPEVSISREIAVPADPNGLLSDSEGNGTSSASVSHRKRGDESEEDNEQAGLLAQSSSLRQRPPLAVQTAHIHLHDYSDEPNPGALRAMYYLLNKPTDAFSRWLIPNCTIPGQRKYYVRSFTLSLILVLLFSFIIMCLVQYMGCVSGMDHAVTGLLVLGMAASLPDIISVGVSARRGLGMMAVSGLVGSNVFDILVGLGFPWLLHIALRGGSVALKSAKVYTGAILAVVAVIIFALSILLNGMRLQRHVAWLPVTMYLIYIVLVLKKVADPPEDEPANLPDPFRP